MKPPFMTQPEAWTRAQRTQADPVRAACAVEKPRPRGVPVADRIGGFLLCVGAGITVALLAVHELAGSVA